MGGQTVLEEGPLQSGKALGADLDEIQFHYDVGDDFYRLWLDPTLCYSCAMWDGEFDDDLYAAQVRKIDFHGTGSRARGKSRVLDVGCGWGGQMVHLVKELGVSEVTGITLSQNQADVINAMGMSGITARVEDWRDHRPDEPYDALIACGVLEHSAKFGLDPQERVSEYRRFFARCWELLAPGGSASFQFIGFEDGYEDSTSLAAFFSKEVFPGSTLPAIAEVVAAAQPWFRIQQLRSDGDQYSHTLRLWETNLEANREAVTELVVDRTFRRYRRYLRLSRFTFDESLTSLFRMTADRRNSVRCAPGTVGG